MAAQENVAPFPPPPRYYEDFEPLSNKDWKPPAPPPPIVRNSPFPHCLDSSGMQSAYLSRVQ